MDEIKKIPPVTRTVVGGVLAVTLPVILQLVSPYRVAFIPHRVAANWELHRLVAPFLFGGGGIQLVFSLIMLYRSLNELEEGHFARRTADMTWAFILICGGIIGMNTPLETPFLFAPFMLAVVHLWAQANATNQVNLYGILTLPAPYFPFAMLGMDLLNGGPGAVLCSFTGMVAAHAYYFLAVIYPRQNNNTLPPLLRSFLTPPQFLTNLVGNGPTVPPSFGTGNRAFSGAGHTTGGGGGGGFRSAFGTAFRGGSATAPSAAAAAAQAPTAQAGRGAAGATGVNSGTGQAQHRWGRGNRLGSD
ncbi:Dfm1p [Rhodotorula paludigena]|uniref:Dfm1p n=1 Tax=Rhodotorula paludigena TaxID=86838 RepID=UPI003172CDA3